MYREKKFNAFNKETWEMMYNVWFDNTCKNWDNWIIFLQYTWLKDKNWKEIYEGYIVIHPSFTTWTPWLVIMHEGKWCMRWERNECVHSAKQEYEIIEHFTPLFQWNGEVEIIWNIYENPDLLTK